MTPGTAGNLALEYRPTSGRAESRGPAPGAAGSLALDVQGMLGGWFWIGRLPQGVLGAQARPQSMLGARPWPQRLLGVWFWT